MHKKIEKTLRIFLTFLAIYLILDGGIHLFNIRLQSVTNIWPLSALSYASFINALYASFVFLTAGLVLTAQASLKKYKSLILVSGFWAIFHGLLLIYLSLTQNFPLNLPSLYVWLPFYNLYLVAEALLSFIYATLVFIWIKYD